MGTSDKILLAQTIAIGLGVLAALGTIWAMFKQTHTAASIADRARRQECVERLLALASPRKWPPAGDGAFYRLLNSVPALFAFDRDVLEQFRLLRQTEVHRDPTRGAEAYTRLLVLMAAASHLTLTEADIDATFGVQWGPSR
jgi:hypothetical protein